MDIETIAKNIKKYRKLRGFTQEELAVECGISLMSIRRYEKAERIANEQTLRKIAKVLGVSLPELEGYDENQLVELFTKAYRTNNPRELEKLFHMPEGSLFIPSPEEQEEFEKRYSEKNEEKEKNIKNFAFLLKYMESSYDETFFDHLTKIAHSLDKLNEVGREKATERVEELTKVPDYLNDNIVRRRFSEE